MTTTTEPRASVPDAMLQHRRELLAAMTEPAETALRHGRDMSSGEQERHDAALAELEKLDERIDAIVKGESKATEFERSFAAVTGRTPATGQAAGRYNVDPQTLRAAWSAITRGETHSGRAEFRARVTASADMGSATSWASTNPLPAVSLREFAGIALRGLEGLSAQHPSLTLPSGSAGVSESTTHAEFDGVAPSTLTAARYGSWSEISAAVKEFEDFGALDVAHAISIARSLTLADITPIDAQAGTPVVFSAATFEQSLREAIFAVAATVNSDVSHLVVYGQPAALAVATSYSPTNGDDRGSVVERVFGARVYPTLGAAANRLTVFAPSAFLAFESGLGSATLVDPTDGSMRWGSWLHSTPAGPAIVGGAKALATA